MSGRIILVSNRLPITIETDPDSGEQRLIDSVGGLVAGLKPLHETSDTLWVGSSGVEPDSKTAMLLEERNFVPVDIDPQEYSLYYDGYANNAIWPLFHYFTEFSSFIPEQFHAYECVNRQFAQRVAELANPGDIVWVHDYHLMLLPKMLRDMDLGVSIGFFLHIPFPADDIFRCLPERVEILRGLLGADLIGMHTYEYTDYYMQSVRRVLGIEGRQGQIHMRTHHVKVEAHPLGIDIRAIRDSSYSDEAEKYLLELKRNIGDRQVILGIDRLDYTKGLLLKLQAFERLLQKSDRWAERVLFIQLAVPTREDIDAYQELKALVERKVAEINGIYGSPVRSPINYLYQTVTPAQLGALYRLADVCFVAPRRDGLNLVAKEYVACREDGGGVLVLSEFAGVASELGEALRINPWDIEATAVQLERALEMGFGERNERMRPMLTRVRDNDVHAWSKNFILSLQNADTLVPATPPMVRSSILASTLAPGFETASNALLMLDYDGSLREFENRFEDAEPTAEIIGLLEGLGSLEGVRVFVNSGRDHHNLGDWFGEYPVDMIAEHGAWLRTRDDREWRPLGIFETSWKDDVRNVLEDYTARTPGTRVEDKETALVWHYREAEEEHGNWQAKELASLLETSLRNEPVQVLHGAKIIEVRLQGLTKARAYDRVVELFGPFDFILATGDDRTDEDLFTHVGDEVSTIKIGSGGSAARTALSSPRALRDMLKNLLEAKGGRV